MEKRKVVYNDGKDILLGYSLKDLEKLAMEMEILDARLFTLTLWLKKFFGLAIFCFVLGSTILIFFIWKYSTFARLVNILISRL